MKKSDLKTGDVITTKSGKYVRVYLDTQGGDIVCGETWFPLKDYSDELLFEHVGAIHDYQKDSCFVAVWRPTCNMNFKESKPNISTHKLIWEFLEPVRKTESQIQLEQVMSKLSELQNEAQRLQEILAKESK